MAQYNNNSNNNGNNKGQYTKGLKYRMAVIFSIMAVIPILAFVYLVSIYLFPTLKDIFEVSAIVAGAILISLLGFILAKKSVEPIINMSMEAKRIANGEYNRKVTVVGDDEVGELGMALNILTQRIKTSLDDLRSYGQKTKEINLEIQKKVFVLSSLLQIGELISRGSCKLDIILEMTVGKAAMIYDTGFCLFFMSGPKEGSFTIKNFHNLEDEKITELVLEENDGSILDAALKNPMGLAVDESTEKTKPMELFRERYSLKNILAIPIISGKRRLGLFVVGNQLEDFRFRQDDIDIIKVFAKQIAIAVENDGLLRKAEELSVIDELTGLYNKNFMAGRMDEEIRRAIFYQRPCALIIFNIDNFKTLRESKGEITAEDVLRKMGKFLRENTSPMSKVGRTGGDEFMVMLPEKNKKEAIALAEDIRKKIESSSRVKDLDSAFTVSAGVSENPIDGSTKEELFKKALEALTTAKSSGKNRVAI